MPIYEYRCRACGHRFDHLARSMAEKSPPCPSCGAKRTVKQPSVFNARVDSPPASSCSTGSCPTGDCPLT